MLGDRPSRRLCRSAVDRAYEACGKIQFEGAHYRKDIAARALKTKIVLTKLCR